MERSMEQMAGDGNILGFFLHILSEMRIFA